MTAQGSEQNRRRLLPPRGLQLSLIAQVPGIVISWPLHPPGWAVAIAATFVLCAAYLNVAAARQFVRHGVGIVPFSNSPELMRGGPFRLSRNPMYLGLVMFSSAAAIGTGVWANLWAPAIYAMWLHLSFVLPEEAFLRKHFGDAFDEYARKIPRWI